MCLKQTTKLFSSLLSQEASLFAISVDPIDSVGLLKKVESARAGAIATFYGVVRNRNDGKNVSALEYEVYETLALLEGEKILLEAAKHYPLEKMLAVHRRGYLELQELAVFIAVSSAHRDAAFAACRYIIDTLKQRLPIWKKEYYQDGSTSWVSCQHLPWPESGSLSIPGKEGSHQKNHQNHHPLLQTAIHRRDQNQRQNDA